MKRYLTLAITAALMLSAFSCGSGGEGKDSSTSAPDSTGEETTAPEETDGLPEKDMDKFELKIVHFDGNWLSWALTKLDAESETGDRLNDAIYKRNRNMEERFNCEINVTGKETITAGDIQSEIMAGDSNYDVWFMYDNWTLGAVEYLLPWEELPYINLDREWWNPSATEVFNLEGKTYAAAGNYSLSVLSRASGFAFNKDIYNKMNRSENIYDLAREGKWTIDVMYDTAKNAYIDLDGDSSMNENDQYGISGSWKETFWRFLSGSDVRFISKDSNSDPVFDLSKNETAINKMLKIFDLFTEKGIYYNPQTKDVHSVFDSEEIFADGRLLFKTVNCFDLEALRTCDIDIGILPCPKYDENQENYYAPSFGAEISVLLKTLPEERKENVGMLLEALAYDSNANILPEYKEVLLKTKLARDNESEEMIDIILNSISFDFGINAWQNEVGVPIVQRIYVKNDPNVASTLAKMQKSVDAQIKKLVEKLGK